MRAEAVLALNELCLSFGSIAALQGVTLEAGEGEVIGLLGGNGSGKSTLLRVMAGLLVPDRGTIAWWGQGPLARRSLSRIGVLFDHAGHWEPLTGYENARFFARAYGLAPAQARERLDALFDRFDLRERQDDPVATYSYGMRRKLGLIEALVHAPHLLLLDEPSMGIDYHARLALYTLVQETAEAGTTVVFASNDMHEATALATRVVLLRHGEVIATGAPSVLMRSLDRAVRIEIRLSAPVPLDGLRGMPGIEGVGEETDDEGLPRLQVLAREAAGDRESSALLARVVTEVVEEGGQIRGIEIERPSLGDLFMRTREEGG